MEGGAGVDGHIFWTQVWETFRSTYALPEVANKKTECKASVSRTCSCML